MKHARRTLQEQIEERQARVRAAISRAGDLPWATSVKSPGLFTLDQYPGSIYMSVRWGGKPAPGIPIVEAFWPTDKSVLELYEVELDDTVIEELYIASHTQRCVL